MSSQDFSKMDRNRMMITGSCWRIVIQVWTVVFSHLNSVRTKRVCMDEWISVTWANRNYGLAHHQHHHLGRDILMLAVNCHWAQVAGERGVGHDCSTWTCGQWLVDQWCWWVDSLTPAVCPLWWMSEWVSDAKCPTNARRMTCWDSRMVGWMLQAKYCSFD